MSRKSISMLSGVVGLSLMLAACGGVEATDEAPVTGNLESVEQNLQPVPACPPGDSVVYWSAVAPTCGVCTVTRKAGQYLNGYAACSSNISGTTALISRTCQLCELL